MHRPFLQGCGASPCMYVCMYVCMSIQLLYDIYIYIYIYVSLCMCVYVYVYIIIIYKFMYICICIYIYIYIYTYRYMYRYFWIFGGWSLDPNTCKILEGSIPIHRIFKILLFGFQYESFEPPLICFVPPPTHINRTVGQTRLSIQPWRQATNFWKYNPRAGMEPRIVTAQLTSTPRIFCMYGDRPLQNFSCIEIEGSIPKYPKISIQSYTYMYIYVYIHTCIYT